LKDFIEDNDFSEYFCKYYLKPMVGSIWSSPLNDSLDILFNFFVSFFRNHGMLSVNDRPDWYVIKNGSSSYINQLLKLNLFNYHLKANITSVKRNQNDVNLTFDDGTTKQFDYVVFANHGDGIIPLLKDATYIERDIFDCFAFSKNHVVLHSDHTRLPKSKLANSAWNYNLNSLTFLNKVTITYNMSILQRLNLDRQMLVSLNQKKLINPDLIYGEYYFNHPIFNSKTIIAQNRVQHIQGKSRTYYCGAYLRYGFHEDGVWSAKQVVDKILNKN
jgi:predicted NAD/FAD-binding protein